MVFYRSFLSLFLSVLVLSACSEIELASHFGKKMMGDQVESKGYYKVGSPYTIKGKRYYPSEDYGYDETGVASWYGPNFHGKMTANGERFDQNELTAAHKTLPLPSIVRVTNLENGKSLIVRVNDRGPYAHSRIIDMSKRSAELLGFRQKGTAKVRVQVLEPESKMVANAAKQGHDTGGMEVPMNQRGYKSPEPVQVASADTKVLSAPKSTSIPGHIKQGQFYPDPMISEYPVSKAQRLYLQMASFSSRENATKFASSLDAYGRAQVYPKEINGTTFYRVRFSAQTVADADALLERVIADGFTDTRIVVD